MADLTVFATQPEPAAVSNDTTSLLGTAYVLEGSSLGARVLVKRAAALGFDDACGARYLTAQAASLERWRNLLAELERVEREEWDRAAAAAKAVFSHAIKAFATEELLTA